jgi:N-methylhydantoinase A
MSLRICVDIGGTFTDIVSIDDRKTVRIAKSPTTPEDYSEGVLECIKIVAADAGVSVADLLEKCTYFAHGSTVVTNAVIEHKVAKVGFLVTRGFRDILVLREGGKEDPFDPRQSYPKPYVPRYLTFPITERITSEGGVAIPVDEREVEAALHKLIDEYRVDSIGVCFLWSILNPSHENRVREIVAEKWPEIPCVLSCDTNPIIREYRRAISAAIEASVRPIAGKYVRGLRQRLIESGFEGNLYIVTSTGSIIEAEDAAAHGISMIGSGPAMAPVAARWFDSLEGSKEGNVISIDMGGTSLDVSLVTDGEIARTRESKVGEEQLGINVIDARSIGAGGGSIAWVDAAGLIHVGPESAGAMPGPACYNRGGTKATVTDANVILGYIDPDYFLGSRMKIVPDLAEKAIRTDVATPLDLDLFEAAFTIWSTTNVNMVSAIQEMTVWQGIDPREYILVAGGGAANCHSVALARELGIKKILVPCYGGVLSAVGGMIADVAADFSGSYFTTTSKFDYKGISKLLEDLEKKASTFLEKLEGTPVQQKIEFYVDARYSYQVWEITVPLRKPRITGESDLTELTEDFHEAHQRIFGIKEPGQIIECVNWSARAVAATPEFQLLERPSRKGDSVPKSMGQREAYFKGSGGMVNTLIYRGIELRYGDVAAGPAIIEEATTTIVIPPGCTVEVTKYGDYLIDIDK